MLASPVVIFNFNFKTQLFHVSSNAIIFALLIKNFTILVLIVNMNYTF